MTRTYLHTETGDEWHGDTGSIVGTSVYEIEVETFFDRDIGGTDGPEARATLLRVEIDGLHLGREAIAKVATEAAVRRCEEIVAEGARIDARDAA